MTTNGRNLVEGVNLLLRDLEGSGDLMRISQTDTTAFEVGRNLATTPGKVVFQNELLQLIQYSPTTEQALEVPLVIFPPWINRFYILDLNPKKSFVRWAVAQGVTVFMVSWKSADASMKDVVWDDYVRAQLAAIDHIRERLGVKAVHAIGYCVAGTTLAATLALLARRGEADKVKSATFFTAQVDFEALATTLGSVIGAPVSLSRHDDHAVLSLHAELEAAARRALLRLRTAVHVMASGAAMELYKGVGLPNAVAGRFGLAEMSGTHAIGHTRMATESAVTIAGAHPFSTGADQCLVHNGSLSNHNAIRRKLQRAGQGFVTENDTEVAAGYLSWRMAEGARLDEALTEALSELDGFYTFVVGTRSGFGVLRDPVACKPAVMAETDDYVAFGSEYRALVDLPGIEDAHLFGPEPQRVYFWER